MKIKILFVIDGLEFGGGERVFVQIIKGLPTERYEVHAASYGEGVFRTELPGSVTFHPLDFRRRTNPGILFNLLKLMKETEIHIVHGQGARAEFFARIASRLCHVPAYVSTVAMPVEGYNVSPSLRTIYEVLDHATERFVTRFLVCSSALERLLAEDHGIHEEKIVKIYNGIEWREYEPAKLSKVRQEVRTRLGVGEMNPLIGAIGRLVWQKGFLFFLRAIPHITQRVPEARFLLVGDGPLRQVLEEEAKRLKISNRITFTGFTTEAKTFMSAMDVIVIPSLREGFPMVTLEAMALEKAIVATEIDGIDEQIRSGKEGILVPPQSPEAIARAVVSLIKGEEDALKLGRAARERVKKEFSVEKMIDETRKVYEDLIMSVIRQGES